MKPPAPFLSRSSLLLLCLALCLCLPAGTAHAENPWKLLRYGSELSDVQMLTASTGFAVGEGMILKTIDGGVTWNPRRPGSYSDFEGVHFVDANMGWAVGSFGGVSKTTDGGTTWTSQTTGSSVWFSGVRFVTATTGLIVGRSGTIYKTTDGGATWSSQTSGTTEDLTAVTWLDASTACVVGEAGTILKSTDGGTTWTAPVSGTSAGLSDVYFPNASTGWAVKATSSTTILKSLDGGSTWTTQVVGAIAPFGGTPVLYGLSFVDANTGWGVGNSGVIVKTTDGGTSWAAQTSGTNLQLKGVHFTDANRGIAVGSQGTILRTTDGGATWNTQHTETAYQYQGPVFFLNASTGWYGYGGGGIFRTTDGGATWTSSVPPNPQPYRGIHFLDANNGWVVGDSGRIARSTDGGATWSEQTGVAQNLTGVHFVDTSTGWATGTGGTILNTTNSGSNWAAQSSGVTSTLEGVQFVSATTGWVVGAGGNILKTTDSGATWLAQTSGVTQDLKSLSFVSATTGWVVGSEGKILKTTDAGSTWTVQTVGNSERYIRVVFNDANNGRVMSDGGAIARTTNGGTTWTQEYLPTSLSYSGMHFPEEHTGYVIGDKGIVWKFTEPATGITVEHPATEHLRDGADTIDFGYVSTGSTRSKTFTIRNTGYSALPINSVAPSGGNAGDFTVNTTGMLTSVPVGGSTTFSITFNPGAAAARTTILQVVSTDPDEGTFDVTLNGTGFNNTAPTDIALSPSAITENNAANATVGTLTATDADNPAAGQTHTFTLVPGNGSTDNARFTITDSALKLTEHADFEVQPTYAIRVRATDDASPPATFDKELTVTVTDVGSDFAEIAVEQPTSTDLTDGSLTAINFGSIIAGSSTPLTFTVRNAGTGAYLTLATPTVVGDDASDFIVSTSGMSTSVAPSGSTTFTVTFNPASAGSKITELRITSNDADESPFNIRLSGTATPAPPANLLVDAAGDVDDANYTAGNLTLREAIAQANVSGDTNAITFASALNGTPILLASALPTITKPVTITGNGAGNTVIDAQQNARVFIVDDGSSASTIAVTLTGMTLRNGKSPAGGNGGGILSTEDLTIRRCAIVSNVATGPGSNGAPFGGAVFASNTLLIEESTISGNTSDSIGGGVFFNDFGTATLRNVTISGNEALGCGGFGITRNGLNTASATFVNCTVVGNSGTAAPFPGLGGIVAVNSGVTLSLENTIVAGNQENGAPGEIGILSSATIPTANNNLIGHPGTAGGLVHGTNGNILGNGAGGTLALAGIVGSLADNGGPTQTRALVTGSPAIDAGSNSAASAITTDQRGAGYNRVTNTTVDIGAFEFGSSIAVAGPDITVSGNDDPIAHAASTPSSADHTDFGTVAMLDTQLRRTFTITSAGTGTLTLTGTPKVVLSGAHAADFKVTRQPQSPIASFATSTFEVTFDPSLPGLRTATVSIASDDPDSSPFTFAISGFGSLIAPLTQTITFVAPSTVYLNQSPLSLTATSSSGLPVTLTVVPAVPVIATLSGNSLALTGSTNGSVKVQATQAGGGLYKAATAVTVTIAVKINPTVLTLINLSQVYDGSPKPIDTKGGSATITYKVGATYVPDAPTNVGSYPVKAVAVVGGLIKTGTLVIAKAPLYVTPDDKRKFSGRVNPPLTFVLSGFRGTDTDIPAVVLTRPVLKTTATTTSAGGLYPITASGGTSANYAFIYRQGTMVVETFAGSYEALLRDGTSLPVGKLVVTVTKDGQSFSGKLFTAEETAAIPLAGPVATNATTGEANAQVTVLKLGVPYTVSFTLPMYGAMTALATRDYAVLGTAVDGRKILILPSGQKVLYAGTHTAVMEPATPGAGVPVGAGWATGTISTAGVLTLTGKLADGTAFTSALSPDVDPDPGYRLFIQPYLVARTQSYLAGAFSLVPHPTLVGRRYLEQTALTWKKAGLPADISYRAGFGPVPTVMMIDPWQAPAGANTLAVRLGLTGSSFAVSHSATGSASQALLATRVLLTTANKVTVQTPVTSPVNVTKWNTSLTVGTGTFTGSFEVTDGLQKRPVTFSGILRQPAEGADTVIGDGHYILPALTGAPTNEKVSGEILFLRP